MKHRSTILAAAMAVMLTGAALLAQSGNDLFSLALQKEKTQGYTEAIKLYQTILEKHGSDSKLVVKTLLRLGSLYEKVGNPDARLPYERIVTQFPREKAAVQEASNRLVALRGPRSREVRVDLVSTGRDVNYNRPSPDGRYLVRANRGRGVFLYDTMLDVERQLLADSAIVKFPIFTPDGKRVFYTRFDGDRGEIRGINIDGSDAKTLYSTTQYSELELSAVSADGKRIALGLILRDGAGPVGPSGGRAPFWQIGLVTVGTGELTVLKSLEWRDTYSGNFSPDGKWLVYSAQVGDDRGIRDLGIFTIAVDGSAHHTLVGREMAVGTPFFTPDGSRVVFLSGDRIVGGPGDVSTLTPAAQKTLYAIRVADGKPIGAPEGIRSNISSGPYSGFLMGLSRDGSIYFDEIQDKDFISVADIDPGSWIVKGTPSPVSDPFRRRFPRTPRWSPDGKKLAYISNDSESVLVIHDLQSGDERTYSSGSVRTTFEGWAPDNKSVLLGGPPQGLRLVDLETRRERPVPLRTSWPMLSPDGKSILYVDPMAPGKGASGASRTVHVKRHDLELGSEDVVRSLTVQGYVSFPTLSPDGRSVALTFAEPGEKAAARRVIPLDGGPARVLPSVTPTGAHAFTSDSSAVLFVRPGNEVWVQPLSGGEAYSTGLRMRQVGDLMLNPRGDRLAFYWSEVIRHVWAYRNLVP